MREADGPTRRQPSARAYEELLELRTGLRRFLHWSETQAQAAGLTPAQHQLLLAIRGHGDRRGPTIGEIADYLVLRHHSAVGLIDRAVAAGLVVRSHDDARPGTVSLSLTTLGGKRLERSLRRTWRSSHVWRRQWRRCGERSISGCRRRTHEHRADVISQTKRLGAAAGRGNTRLMDEDSKFAPEGSRSVDDANPRRSRDRARIAMTERSCRQRYAE